MTWLLMQRFGANMRHLWVITLFGLLACGGSPGGTTVVHLHAAKVVVHVMQPKAEAMKKLTEALGDPSGEDEGSVWWNAGEGADCKQLKVQWMGGQTTGNVQLQGCS